ncbi:MAG TPA: T9SS type A sorting domain-containing protein, partial [Flavobacteriales bacterium]|nr:T9SS type A sorting domain-containing protein [Flavobacteriales bacterium]
DDAHTDTVHLNAQPSWGAYYLYDAICVSPTQGECPMATGLPESIDGSILVNITGGGQWLQLDGAATGSKTWVYDAGGRLMAQFAFSGSSTQPIGNWPPGVYVLQVQGGDGTVWHKKFVVMR